MQPSAVMPVFEDMGGYRRIWEDMGGVTLAIISGIGRGDMGGSIDHTLLHAAQDWGLGYSREEVAVGLSKRKGFPISKTHHD